LTAQPLPQTGSPALPHDQPRPSSLIGLSGAGSSKDTLRGRWRGRNVEGSQLRFTEQCRGLEGKFRIQTASTWITFPSMYNIVGDVILLSRIKRHSRVFDR